MCFNFNNVQWLYFEGVGLHDTLKPSPFTFDDYFWFIVNRSCSVNAELISWLLVFCSPSTVILIMASGLSYADFPITNLGVLLVLLCLITIGYALICLYTSQEFQLKAAKLLTIVFALLMAFVTVGVAAQAGDDLYKRAHPPTPSPSPTAHPWTPWKPTTNSSRKYMMAALGANRTSTQVSSHVVTTAAAIPLEDKLPMDVSSLYLFGLIGIFFLAAVLHPTEAACLVDGLWYLLCLPSGYLLLVVYSICNITDRSWGKKRSLCSQWPKYFFR